MSDQVNHPKHYNSGKIEVIEFLEDQKLEPHEWNCVKYVCRAKHKGKRIEDLEKAIWYLRRKIEILKAEEEKREPLRPNAMNEERRLVVDQKTKIPANCTCGHGQHVHVFEWQEDIKKIRSTKCTVVGCDCKGFNSLKCKDCGHLRIYHDFPPDRPITPGSLIRCVNGCRCTKFEEVG